MLQSEVLPILLHAKLTIAHRVQEELPTALSAQMPKLERLEEGCP